MNERLVLDSLPSQSTNVSWTALYMDNDQKWYEMKPKQVENLARILTTNWEFSKEYLLSQNNVQRTTVVFEYQSITIRQATAKKGVKVMPVRMRFQGSQAFAFPFSLLVPLPPLLVLRQPVPAIQMRCCRFGRTRSRSSPFASFLPQKPRNGERNANKRRRKMHQQNLIRRLLRVSRVIGRHCEIPQR